MKIVSLNTDHTNPNYNNCLKQACLLVAKQEADIIAFHEVRFRSYGVIKEYLHFKDFNNELDESVRLGPFGELLLLRQKFRDTDFHKSSGTMSYISQNCIVSISRLPKHKVVTDHLRTFTLPNGNIRPTILIDPQNTWLLTTDNEEMISYSKQKQTGASKYPINIGFVDLD